MTSLALTTSLWLAQRNRSVVGKEVEEETKVKTKWEMGFPDMKWSSPFPPKAATRTA